MAQTRPQRISIGFQGGQVLSTRVTEKDLDQLERALERGGWHALPSEDGTVQLNVEQVVYVRVESDEHRVGFGA